MNQAAETVELGHCYRLQHDALIKSTNNLENTSRLTLYSCSPRQHQLNELTSLVKHLDSDFVVLPGKISQGSSWQIESDFKSLQSFVKSYVMSSSFDYLLWPEGVCQPPAILLFDMDSTFIEIEVIDELAKRAGVGEKVATVTESAMRGELDFAQSLVSRVACLKGLDESVIDEIAENLPVSTGVPRLVENAHLNDCKVAIVSGGFTPFVRKLRETMGLYRVHANRLKVDAGRLTGHVEGDIVDAQAKAIFLQELCESLGIKPERAMAIGDGANDLAMMQIAGFNLAYRAKPKVQAQAKGRINETNLGVLGDIFDWSA